MTRADLSTRAIALAFLAPQMSLHRAASFSKWRWSSRTALRLLEARNLMTQAFPLSEVASHVIPCSPLSQGHQKNKVGGLGIRHLVKAQGKGRIEPLPNPGVRLHLAVLTIQDNGLLKLAGRDSHLDQGYDGTSGTFVSSLQDGTCVHHALLDGGDLLRLV